ncbi:MAG: ribose 1,5-bisphosphate isomerase, partial [Thaumarchaeota archaeon]
MGGQRGGACIISRAVAEAIKLKAREIEAETTIEFLERLRALGEEVIALEPSMASVRNAVETILSRVKKAEAATPEECIKLVSEAADELIERSRNAVEKISEYGSGLIIDGDTILTHSCSHTVLKVLERAHEEGKKFRVIVTESRPLLEGRETASELLSKSIPVTLIVDAAICTVMRDVDKVMIGADAILADGSIVNKVGSLPIALAAYASNVPLIVVVESLKF